MEPITAKLGLDTVVCRNFLPFITTSNANFRLSKLAVAQEVDQVIYKLDGWCLITGLCNLHPRVSLG